MIPNGKTVTTNQDEHLISIGLLYDIVQTGYGKVSPLLKDMIFDVTGLYEGRWGTHEACQVGYHNLGHAIDVALLTARMISGWNKLPGPDRPQINEEFCLCALAAALFHDSGYIKEKGDKEGRGGKFSFSHEVRSMAIASKYLAMKGWPAATTDLVPRIIALTEFHKKLVLENHFDKKMEEIIGRMVATADLVAQMADVDYIQRINCLYEELKEAYKYEGEDKLAAQGIRIFHSAREMIDGTIDFYENFVMPRLQQLGRMDQYLISFFNDGRNPYLENIAANLSSKMVDKKVRWRRLGDILEELGLVKAEQIQKALARQRKQQKKKLRKNQESSDISFRERILAWMEDSQFSYKCLGDILMDMKVISSPTLRKGLLFQMLPVNLVQKLTRDELLFLLQISLLLQNIGRGPWLFGQILEMTNELLDCESSCILLANPDTQEMLIAIPTGPNKDFLDGRTIPADKGLAGWVFSHGRPAVVSNVKQDERFDMEVDRNNKPAFETRSLLAVPLHINGELIGVMEVLNKSDDNFTEHDMDILTILANLIAVSLDNIFRLQELYSGNEDV
ncbi:MAG: GAF domain-containing protein [Proteobacteria bacterium]|nr:GAF domain-containing protein [Pseudomonadota bacterium]MBU1717160.1 GAF domain-containing protein [Pseudomonadota bacterium]